MYESGDQAKKGTNQELEFLASMTSEERDLLLGRVQPFMKLMMQYRCAIREMETKLQVLNDEFSLQHERNPFESIESRVKEPMSIIEKMRRRGWDLTVDNIEDKLNDVAGVRVICSFVEDIYYLADMLAAQDDLNVLQVKDYIKHPKDNGYRSLHLIIGIPIFLSSEKKYVQGRSAVSYDCHGLLGESGPQAEIQEKCKNPELIAAELKKCADTISSVDLRMQEIRNMMEEGEM